MQQAPGDECVKGFFFFKSLSGEKVLPVAHVKMWTLATCLFQKT